ncbi:hypothetical protein TD95_004258 [Thielaviopsis punctulata]|uniref:Kinesin motor domain-containing protein n=1 Tax=Thielaviopsis punctulata TaxID=72032 RepID=A0A0F4Z8X3_9PEZI|nr:hypothetical protein TD95_004258 [Thielaviopsis punctulata]
MRSASTSSILPPGRRLTKRSSTVRPPTAQSTHSTSGTAPSRSDRPSRATSPAESVNSAATASGAPSVTGKRKDRDFETDVAAVHADETTNINVVVRCRGRNEREIKENSNVVVMTDGVKGKAVELSMGPNAVSNKSYGFDRVFSPAADQTMVFDEVVKPILDEMLAGYNCTIFAYGQTGTGKTYTMSGDMTETLGLLSDNAGIIPRVLQSLFRQLELDNSEYLIKCSFIELYNEELRDLVTSDDSVKLKIYEDNSRRGHSTTVVQGVEEKFIKNAVEGIRLLQEGSMKRQVAATKCNDLSSRSHTVFTITACIKKVLDDGNEDYISAGKLNLVDLAGSENIQRSGAENKRAAEAGLINKSLLTLGRVINALVDRSQHIPYRESKLTRLLQDSLGGRTKTCIIATISPAKVNLEETISTLDYAFRAKNIRNKPQMNAKVNRKALLQELANDIERLKMELIATRQRNGVYLTNESFEEMTATSESRRIVMAEQSAKIETLETNLRNKAQELWNLTTTFTGLRKEHEAVAQTLSQTKGALEHTEIILTEARKTLADETMLRKAHQMTELELTKMGNQLLSTIQRTVQDVDNLHAKNKRKSDLESVNRSVWGSTQKQVVDVTAQVEERVHKFRELQEEALEKMTGQVDRFVDDEYQNLNKFDEDIGAFRSNFESKRAELTSEYEKMLGDFGADFKKLTRAQQTVYDNLQTCTSEVGDAARKISSEVLPEMASLHKQLQSSYADISKEFRSLFDRMSAHMAAQKTENDRLKQELAAAVGTVAEQNKALASMANDVLEAERRNAAADRTKLLAQISDLIDANAVARDQRLTAQFGPVAEQLTSAAGSLEAATTQHDAGVEALDEKHAQFVKAAKQSRDRLRSKMDEDWAAANEQTTTMEKTSKNVHASTVAALKAQTNTLDQDMELVTSQAKQVHRSGAHFFDVFRDSMTSLEDEFETVLRTASTTVNSSIDRVKSLGDTMVADGKDAVAQLEPIQGNICQPLADLRADISSRQLREYTATGNTPKRVQYTFPTSLPQTASPSTLLRRMDMPTPTEPEPETDADGDVVFSDAVHRAGTPVSSSQDRTGPASPSVRPSTKRTTTLTSPPPPAVISPPARPTGLRESNLNQNAAPVSHIFDRTVTTTIPLAPEGSEDPTAATAGTGGLPASRLRKPSRRLTGKKLVPEGRENQVQTQAQTAARLSQGVSRRRNTNTRLP